MDHLGFIELFPVNARGCKCGCLCSETPGNLRSGGGGAVKISICRAHDYRTCCDLLCKIGQYQPQALLLLQFGIVSLKKKKLTKLHSRSMFPSEVGTISLHPSPSPKIALNYLHRIGSPTRRAATRREVSVLSSSR